MLQYKRFMALGRISTFIIVCLSLTSPAAVAQPVADFQFVSVDKYRVKGNTLLDEQTIDRVLGRFTGSVTLGFINEAALLLQNEYRSRGYGTVVVTIPPQEVKNRIVDLLVVEGRVSSIQIAGIVDLSRDNLLRTLPALKIDNTVDFSELDGQLLMANESPVKNVRVLFQPGQNLGQVDALVIVEERPQKTATVSIDNSGAESTGRDRITVSLMHGNIADRDVVGNLRYTTSISKPSQVSIASASFRMPVYERRVFLETFARYSNTTNTPNQTPIGELQFAGEGQSLGLKVIQLLTSLDETKRQVFVGLEQRELDNTCSLGVFGPEGCGGIGLDLTVRPLTLGLVLQKLGQYSVSFKFAHNLPAGANGNQDRISQIRADAKSRFNVFQISALGYTPVSQFFGVNWRSELQFSSTGLVNSEQIGIGGAYSVRGYEERQVAGDSGLSATAEFLLNPSAHVSLPEYLKGLQVFSFVDAGIVKNQNSFNCDAEDVSCSLWSYGVGARVNLDNNLAADLSVGVAGKSQASVQKGDFRTHVNVSYGF